MKIDHNVGKIRVSVSDFINRACRLSKEKRSFLLEIMEQTRLQYQKIAVNPLYQRYPSTYHPWEKNGLANRQKRELKLALQMGSVAIWMLLDDSKKREKEQIELRLREIDRLVMHHGLSDMYEAMKSQISGTIFDETYEPSDESVPNHKQEEYEYRLNAYMQLTGSGRERFIKRIQFPQKRQRNIPVVQIGRQREG